MARLQIWLVRQWWLTQLGAVIISIGITWIMLVEVPNNFALSDAERLIPASHRKLVEQLNSVIAGADLVLETFIGQHDVSHAISAHEKDELKTIARELPVRLKSMPNLAFIVISDETGVVRASAVRKISDNWQLDVYPPFRGKPWFDSLQRTDSPGMVVDHYSTASQGEVVFLARRFDKHDGSFGGVVMMGIVNPYHFHGREWHFVALSNGSDVFTHWPLNATAKLELALSAPVQPPSAKPTELGYMTVVESDGTRYFILRQELAYFPIVVTTVVTEGEYLASYFHQSSDSAIPEAAYIAYTFAIRVIFLVGCFVFLNAIALKIWKLWRCR